MKWVDEVVGESRSEWDDTSCSVWGDVWAGKRLKILRPRLGVVSRCWGNRGFGGWRLTRHTPCPLHG